MQQIKVMALVLAGVLWLGSVAEGEWQNTGRLEDRRGLHTSTLLPSGKVLVIGGYNGGYLSSAEMYDPSIGTWTDAGNLATPRGDHTSTLLPSGKVLVVGGRDNGSSLSSAEMYDPNTGTWTDAGNLATPRHWHTSTLLPSGKVLVVGGRDIFTSLSSAEMYDPITGTWTHAENLLNPRVLHTSTLLPSGEVLVVGSSSAEMYDPRTGRWTGAGNLANPRSRYTSTLLSSGEVLVVGGSSAEMYDPRTGTWTGAGNLAAYRERHTATLLPSGKVLVVGGRDGKYLSSAEMYDPSTGTWTDAGNLATLRGDHTSTLLPSGKVLVVGGKDDHVSYLPSAEVYDPRTGAWTGAGSLATRRSEHTSTLLPSGTVLVVGGYDVNFNILSSAEMYDPRTGTWTGTGNLANPRELHTSTLLPSGEVLVVGGSNNGGSLSSAEMYDPRTGTWTGAGNLANPRERHTSTLLPSGKVLVVGGTDGGPLSSAEMYDPSTGTWTDAGNLATPRVGHTSTLLPSGKVLIVGGYYGNYLSSAEMYDPNTGTWTGAGNLANPRERHTSTLLPSGKVLVVGGTDGGPLSSAEMYDPSTGTWTDAGNLATPRYFHASTLLASGEVLAVGGVGFDIISYFSSAEIYDPSIGTWADAGNLATPRREHTLTLLPSGKALVIGGYNSISLSSAEIYEVPAPPESRKPVIQSASQIRYGEQLTITGQFRGDSEAGGGNTRNSAVNFPVIHLRALAETAHHTLIPDPQDNFWDTSRILTVSELPATINPGPHLLTVSVAGVASEPVLVDMECSVAITTHPSDRTVDLGESATFTVQSQGGRFYQWQRDGVDIPGATGPTYTTPAVLAEAAGTTYRVLVDSGCTNEYSELAELTINDDTSPQAEITHPTGGEYWLLSSPDTPDNPNTELITWSMSDNVFICEVEVALIYSEDTGSCADPLAPEDGEIFTPLGPGTSCTFPGLESSSFLYTLPIEPPSGVPGSNYKVRVCVTDQAGNVTQEESPNPFFITDRRDDIQTLVLIHSSRMEITPDLALDLQNLNNHPSVQGLLIDLENVTDINDHYNAWDNGIANANDVLFAEDGIHDYLLSLLDIYSQVEHIMLVGDDSVIPMARLLDRTTLLPESAYASELSPDSTVWQALEDNNYLSDDLLATRRSLRPYQLDGNIHLADLNIGRLVETPSEISAAIDAYIAQDGVLDLSQRIPKVLVTGYDFLQESADRIKDDWAAFYTPALEDVDGQLISSDWDVPPTGTSVEERRDLLYNALGQAPGIASLGGHATHAEEGVPGIDRYDLQGLSAVDIAALDLSGCVIYAIGCHGGLPVPDEMDLPQSFLGAGAGAYLAGSGYGWGLLQGIGLSERLSVILTQELAKPEPQRIGDVIRRSKAFYYDTSPRWDDYDTKVLHQPILYGFPMYVVQTDSSSPAPLAPTGRVGVTTATSTSEMGLPPHVVGLRHNFDFTGEDVYRKYDADGNPTDADGNPTSECPPEGCYYELNGLVSGESDLPLEPYFRYNSSLAGTSQHGILWLGGTYLEEDGWTPIIGQLASNDDGGGGLGSTPPKIFLPPRGPQPTDPGDLPVCPAYDEEVNSVVVTTGTPAKAPGDEIGEYSLHRLDQTIELEVFYFNNLNDPSENCDRQGPTFSNAEPHTLSGTTLHWSVEVEDEAGVWRVVAVWDDEQAEPPRWSSLELTYDAVTDRWLGSLPAAGRGELTYMLQAVDNRGNVAWKELESELPPSGVPLGLAEVFTVPIGEGEADLELALDVPPQVEASDSFTMVASLLNHGPDPAHGLTASLSLPEDGIYLFDGGDGWTCHFTPPMLDCTRPRLEAGESSEIFVQLRAPDYGGTQHFSACVVAAEADPTGPACADAEHLVIDESMTDLRIIKEDGGIVAIPGEPIVYSITVINQGPNPAPDSRVVDIFPAELLDVTWTCTATVGSSCTASGSGNIDDLVDLDVNGTLIYIATAIVDPDVISESIVNVATVEVSAAMSDFAESDNSDRVLTPTFHESIFADGFESGDLSAWQ